MDIQQRANLRIYEEFGKRHIEFAYPTQTLYMNKA
jgi:small-conductance mechanosensitive channel